MNSSALYALLLWFLTALFALRVTSQAIQRWFPLAVLPPFEKFQGSNLPYTMLLGAQIVILALMASAAWRVGKGRLAHRPMFAKFLHGFAAIYFTGSVLRILAGALYPDALPWFKTWIPAFFHLVLASFVWTMAVCYAERQLPAGRADTQWWSYAIYPLCTACAFALFAALRAHEVALNIALYVTIIANAVWILVLERWVPEREDWRPARDNVQGDALYIVLVQVALPKLLAMGVVLFLAEHAHRPSSWWPHDWHWTAQTLLMILAVDLLRYWVHRACHHFPALWRLHEVHHSPRLLYSLNTSRFHPLEKVLHFTADTVPFLLLGVAPEVLAGYFLVYAVNGFYQHSNIRLRYGWLNYIVGSAETHRWHHARDPKTAQCNFSSTTLIWDLVFGTWYLPKQQAVDKIGILDDAYPTGFLRQMTAPFR
ncbi:MAG: sterol desaturase family protein [Burkholderiales bacterium]